MPSRQRAVAPEGLTGSGVLAGFGRFSLFGAGVAAFAFFAVALTFRPFAFLLFALRLFVVLLAFGTLESVETFRVFTFRPVEAQPRTKASHRINTSESEERESVMRRAYITRTKRGARPTPAVG